MNQKFFGNKPVYKRTQKCGICGTDKFYIPEYNEILCVCGVKTPDMIDLNDARIWVKLNVNT